MKVNAGGVVRFLRGMLR